MTEFYVKVKPDSKQFKIEKSTYPIIYLVSEAENGRANTELISKLEKILDENVAIISGHKSSRKKLKTDLSQNHIEKRLYGER